VEGTRARAGAHAGRARCPAILDTKGLSAAAPILEEYGLSCENNMSLLDGEDLVVLLQLGQCNYVELIDTIFTDVEGVD